MSRPLVIPDTLRRMQAKASDPSASAWVSANAGSGKTHVLTQRVLRLLLKGAPPGADPRPHLHQGRRGQHGEPHLQHAGRLDEPRRRGADARRSSRPARRSPGPAGAQIRAAIVRPHDRDAGRARRSRLCTPSASGSCSSSRSRRMSLRISRWSTSARPGRLMEEARDRAIAALQSLVRIRRGAGTRVARSRRLQIRRSLRRGAGLRRDLCGLRRRAGVSRPRCDAGSASRPGRRRRASRPRCSAATSAGSVARPGRRGSTAGKTSDREFAAKLREVDDDGRLRSANRCSA